MPGKLGDSKVCDNDSSAKAFTSRTYTLVAWKKAEPGESIDSIVDDEGESKRSTLYSKTVAKLMRHYSSHWRQPLQSLGIMCNSDDQKLLWSVTMATDSILPNLALKVNFQQISHFSDESCHFMTTLSNRLLQTFAVAEK